MACGGTTENKRPSYGAFPEHRQSARKMTMATVISRQSVENMEYVRRLLKEKEPRFSAALELALVLAVLELSSGTARDHAATVCEH